MSLRPSKTENFENQSSPYNEGVNQFPLTIYDTISSHPRQNDKAEGGKYYDVLVRKGMTTDPDIIHEDADMTSYSKLELDGDEIKPEKNPVYTITTTHIKQSNA